MAITLPTARPLILEGAGPLLVITMAARRPSSPQWPGPLNLHHQPFRN
jgi:hypothetical protein